jgi:hypothetical protein
MADSTSLISRFLANRSLQWGFVAVLLGVYAASFFLLRGLEPGSAAAIAVALAPVPLMAFVYIAWAIEVYRGDELERKIALEAIAIGWGCSMAFVLVLRQLELAGALGPDTIAVGDIWHVMFFSTFLGAWRARARYN